MLKRYLIYVFAFILLIAVIFIALLYWQLQNAHNDLADEVSAHAHTTEERDNARLTATQREQQLATLNAHISANAHVEAKLRAELTTAQTTFAERTFLIEKLTHENANLRQWANEPLPADVVCLRQRPQLSGTDAYRAWLSDRRCLPIAGDTTNEQQ